jgi:hypothetical protein
MWLPACKVGKYKTCGGACSAKKFDSAKAERAKVCEVCGKIFVPRLTQLRIGQGRFCSHKCSAPFTAAQMNAPEAREKQFAIMRDLRKRGLIDYAKGPANKNWVGGPEVTRLRKIDGTKKYQKENPEMVRAWAHNRRARNRSLGKLPANTVQRLRVLQKDKCAVCREKFKANSYQLDHIVPLARGGRNEFHKVQLLCALCNQNKSAKVPHVFMQSRGYLL